MARERHDRGWDGENEGVPMMNKWQRVVLLVGLVVSMGLALFPPAHHADYVDSKVRSVTSRSWLFGIENERSILWRRLALELAVVVVPTVVIVLFLRNRGDQ